MILFRLVIVVVHIDAELHFFHHDYFLMLLGLAFLLLLLIQKFPVVHYSAYGRSRGRRNLYQIQVFFAGHLERFVGRQNADLLAFVINHADFPRSNALVCSDKAFIDTVLR